MVLGAALGGASVGEVLGEEETCREFPGREPVCLTVVGDD